MTARAVFHILARRAEYLALTGYNHLAALLTSAGISVSRAAVLRPGFWDRYTLDELNSREWEALCDGCGLCCLLKYSTENDEVIYTSVHCRLLDCSNCRCLHYEARKRIVPDCMKLTPKSIRHNVSWMPSTCAYRLRHEGKPLRDWHYLISGSRQLVHKLGISVKHRATCETQINPDDLFKYSIWKP